VTEAHGTRHPKDRVVKKPVGRGGNKRKIKGGEILTAARENGRKGISPKEGISCHKGGGIEWLLKQGCGVGEIIQPVIWVGVAEKVTGG